MGIRSIIIPVFIILILTLYRCVDPYNPKLDKYQSLLVVNALLTDEDGPYIVRLSRTSIAPDEEPAMATGAQVSITDDLGNNISLIEGSDGIYNTDINTLRGVAGREYTLKVRTSDGKEYESDPVMLHKSPDIDTVYYGKESKITDKGEIEEGISIYIDSKGPAENNYFRWSYEEWWKFNIPYPVAYKYVDENNVYPITPENVTCYKNRKSDEVIIQLRDPDVNPEFIKSPICFLASEKSERLLMQYCIQVSQYAISENEYEFWRLMKDISESGGDIFDRQPYQIMSNIHCVSDPAESVLGYFQVCGIKKKRIYIKGSEIVAMGLKPYQYPCELVLKGPQDYMSNELKPMTFDMIYHNFTMANYNFIAPHYVFSNYYDRLIFADKYCSDCTVSGSPKKPDFWVDLK
jgi:hypothetical protein